MRFCVYSGFKMPRMGLPSIGAVLRREGHEVSIYCQSIRAARIEDLLAADIVGLSTTTSTAPEVSARSPREERSRSPRSKA